MGRMAKLWDRINPPRSPEQRAVMPWNVYGDTDTGVSTNSGTRVSERSAFTYGIVYSAIGLISETIAGLPPEARKKEGDAEDVGAEVATELPQWIRKPHPDIVRFDFIQSLVTSLLAWGNAYCTIVRRPSDGVIVGLDLLDPDTVQVEWDPDKPGYRRYRVENKKTRQHGPWVGSYEVMHLQGPTLPGDPKGLSVIAQAREAIALGLTLQEFGSRYFGQGSMAKIVLEIPRQLEPADAARIVKTYERFHKGKMNWHRPAVASGGAKVTNISIPPEDAQFLQSREFQAMEVAGWFRVPPHRVGITSKSTSWGSGLAEENMMFYKVTLKPWIKRLEEVFTKYAPGGQDLGTLIKLDTTEMLRGTFEEQVDTLSKVWEGGALTKDEYRVSLGWPKVTDGTGGDYYVMPPMTTLDENGDVAGTLQQSPNDAGGGSTPSAQPSSKTPDKPRTKEQDRKRKQQAAKK